MTTLYENNNQNIPSQDDDEEEYVPDSLKTYFADADAQLEALMLETTSHFDSDYNATSSGPNQHGLLEINESVEEDSTIDVDRLRNEMDVSRLPYQYGDMMSESQSQGGNVTTPGATKASALSIATGGKGTKSTQKSKTKSRSKSASKSTSKARSKNGVGVDGGVILNSSHVNLTSPQSAVSELMGPFDVSSVVVEEEEYGRVVGQVHDHGISNNTSTQVSQSDEDDQFLPTTWNHSSSVPQGDDLPMDMNIGTTPPSPPMEIHPDIAMVLKSPDESVLTMESDELFFPNQEVPRRRVSGVAPTATSATAPASRKKSLGVSGGTNGKKVGRKSGSSKVTGIAPTATSATTSASRKKSLGASSGTIGKSVGRKSISSKNVGITKTDTSKTKKKRVVPTSAPTVTKASKPSKPSDKVSTRSRSSLSGGMDTRRKSTTKSKTRTSLPASTPAMNVPTPSPPEKVKDSSTKAKPRKTFTFSKVQDEDMQKMQKSLAQKPIRQKKAKPTKVSKRKSMASSSTVKKTSKESGDATMAKKQPPRQNDLNNENQSPTPPQAILLQSSSLDSGGITNNSDEQKSRSDEIVPVFALTGCSSNEMSTSTSSTRVISNVSKKSQKPPLSNITSLSSSSSNTGPPKPKRTVPRGPKLHTEKLRGERKYSTRGKTAVKSPSEYLLSRSASSSFESGKENKHDNTGTNLSTAPKIKKKDVSWKNRKLTVPMGPNLSTSNISTARVMKNLESIKKNAEDKLVKPKVRSIPSSMNTARILRSRGGILGVSKVTKKRTTEPKPFRLSSDRVNTGSRHTLTKDAKRATTSNNTASTETKKEPFQFRALPMPNFALRAPKPVVRDTRKPLTSPKPFRFLTDSRAAAKKVASPDSAGNHAQVPNMKRRLTYHGGISESRKGTSRLSLN